MDEVNYQALIPELKLWNGGNGIGIDGWLCGVGSYELAIAYQRLFWPEFIAHDDCVFFRSSFSVKNYEGFLEQSKGDKLSVESVMNHLHLADLFALTKDEPSREILTTLGEQLREIWLVKLAHDFPDRVFEVVCGFLGGNELIDCQIYFFQPRDG